MPALVGGGMRARPGEVSLAHNGVLFLDELPEFSPQALDSLRQPLEDGKTVIARANHHVTYPSRFQLVAAMNPCRCGKAGTPGHHCKRGAKCVDDYMARLSGPFMDRVDMHINVGAVMARDLVGKAPQSEKSEAIRKRVQKARQRQSERYMQHGFHEGTTNASVPFTLLQQLMPIEKDAEALLAKAADQFHLSARAFSRVIRLGATLADLSGHDAIQKHDIAEALGYRLPHMGA